MGALFVLSVSGLVTAIPLFEDSDAPASAGNGVVDDEPADVPDDLGAVLDLDGTEPVTGTSGDDTLTSEASFADSSIEINLLSGNDAVNLSGYVEQLEINEGDGDDAIILTGDGVGNTLDGGAGNDMLVAGTGNVLNGGSGNDELTINLPAGIFDGFNISDAGAGDDTITVTSFVGDAVPDFSSAGARGGDLSDAFIAELTVVEDQFADPVDVTTPIGSRAGIVFCGFNPEEDSLLIQMDRAEGQEDRELIDTELVSASRENEYEVRLTFGATDDDPEMTTSVILRDVVGVITLDDIDIAGLVAAV